MYSEGFAGYIKFCFSGVHVFRSSCWVHQISFSTFSCTQYHFRAKQKTPGLEALLFKHAFSAWRLFESRFLSIPILDPVIAAICSVVRDDLLHEALLFDPVALNRVYFSCCRVQYNKIPRTLPFDVLEIIQVFDKPHLATTQQ